MADDNPEIDLTPENNGGVLKKILKEGEGIDGPCKGDKVSVHYVGTLEDGSEFDSSRNRGNQFEFNLGMGQVIKAWDLCVTSMKKGELCKVVCKSEYAYGSTGSPPKIPPNATLIFEIELFSWKGEDLSPESDGGITRKIIKAGEGYTMPNEGALVKVNVKGKFGEHVFFDKSELSFNLGEGCLHCIPEGLETALLKFKKSEHSSIKLLPKYAFGETGNKEFNIPPEASVEYDLELIEFEKCKEAFEMNDAEKLEQAKLFKERGTIFFKEENFPLAVKKYSKMISLLTPTDDNESEINKLLLASRLNLSMCYLKEKDFISSKKHAEEALLLDGNNIKAHFRLGMSLLGAKEPDEALKSFRKCLQIEEGNHAAMQQVKLCQKAIKQDKEKEKKLYSAMFENISK